MKFVGIDPGRRGAAVSIGADGQTVERIVTWRLASLDADLGAAGDLAEWLARGDVLVVEEQYVGRSPRSALRLAMWTGRVLQTLPRPPHVVVLRPQATAWRGKVFGGAAAGRCGRDAAVHPGLSARPR